MIMSEATAHCAVHYAGIGYIVVALVHLEQLQKTMNLHHLYHSTKTKTGIVHHVLTRFFHSLL